MMDSKIKGEETKINEAVEILENVKTSVPEKSDGIKNDAPSAVAVETKTTELVSDAVSDDGKIVKEITVEEEDEKLENIIELSRVYKFEGEEIKTLDLTKIEDLNAIQMQKADNIYRKITKTPATMPETTYDYAIAVAHLLTGYPIEFFKKISAKDLTKIKMRVVAFLYGGE